MALALSISTGTARSWDAAQADPARFDALYRKYLAQVYSYAFYELGDRHEAEDATERTFLAALANLARFDAGLEATEQRIAQDAGDWGFPAYAVADGIDARPAARSSDRDDSTHVFTPDDVGFVHLEFQASHHVREGRLRRHRPVLVGEPCPMTALQQPAHAEARRVDR